jgi:hypothetical protein
VFKKKHKVKLDRIANKARLEQENKDICPRPPGAVKRP